jgi:hypothetical protein
VDVKPDALRHAANLNAAEEKLKNLQCVVADHNDQMERFLAKFTVFSRILKRISLPEALERMSYQDHRRASTHWNTS